jgi:hypothetical protein
MTSSSSSSSSSSVPATSVQALAPAEPRSLRALNKSIEELDDEDLVAIGRIVYGGTARGRLKLVGVSVGIGAATVLAAVSLGGSAVVMAGVSAWTLLSAQHQIRADLIDAGLSDALAAEIAAAIGVTSGLRSNGFGVTVRKSDRKLLDCGRLVVDDARRRRRGDGSSSGAAPAGTAPTEQ